MIKFTELATENQIKIRQQQTLEFLGYTEEKSEPKAQAKASSINGFQLVPEPEIKKESKWSETDGPILDYLLDIHNTPGMKAVERDIDCSYNKNGGTEMRAALKRMGLADFRMQKPGGRGRPWEDWFVTEKGLEALGIGPGNKSGSNRNNQE
jgi:hypothetical protein